ncbi:MAG TPA: hypothetical protein VKB38_14565 [Terracidiphilus sp.]|nr:hypothetical protein [Terracidiphilus sp.]
MDRESCHTCEVLKELYRLKMNHFLVAAKSRNVSNRPRTAASDDEVNRLKEEALRTLRVLMQHLKSCYGLAHDLAA